MYSLDSLCDLFNYAYDNTVGCMSNSFQQLSVNLQMSVRVLLDWYESNYMRANPDKFQCIVFGKKTQQNECIAITDTTELIPLESCKLLGVEVDRKLTFRTHIAAICCKAGRQISALARISKALNTEVKLSMFQSFIMSHFNFCPLVWHFCGVQDLKKQKRYNFGPYDTCAMILLLVMHH